MKKKNLLFFAMVIMCVGNAFAQSSSYRLFSPLAFYPDVYDDVFGEGKAKDDSQQEADRVLAQLYIDRPDLVETTERNLHEAASKADEMPPAPVKRVLEVPVLEMPLADDTTQAQPVELYVKKPNFWTFNGDYSLQFMQNFFSDNWYQSGEKNLAANASVKLQLNYNNKKKVKFENTLEMKLGFQTSESDTVHKYKTTSDLLRYTGKFGLQASKRWYYTLQGIATTQFAYGLKSNDHFVYSDFFSPLIVNLSIGMDYTVESANKKLTGSVHLAPLAYNWKHVSRLGLSTRNGIREGHHSLQDYGSQIVVNLCYKPSETFKWDTRAYWYTSFNRTELEWENTFTFSFSKYISAKLYIYPRFDDGTVRDKKLKFWQFKEFLSLGFSYSM